MFKKLIFVPFLLSLISCTELPYLHNESASEVYVDGELFCSVIDANKQLHTYMREWYFWNEDISENFNPAEFDSIPEALKALRVPQDRFSFSMTDEAYADYNASRYLGYGFSAQVNTTQTGLLVRLTYEHSTAYQAGLRRGDTIVSVDGVSVETLIQQVTAEQTSWEEIFGPEEVGYGVDIEFIKPTGESIADRISKKEIVFDTVLFSEVREVEQQKIGYLVFNSFKEKSKEELNRVFNTFAQEGVSELVLDMRYNGGGLNDTANQLASQIAGDNVANELFMEMKFNGDKQFENQRIYFSRGQADTNSVLNLSRVFILQTESTCSAAELVRNALAPFIEVISIGSNTCGKPIGMYPTGICNDVVFAINFQSINAEGFGDYFDGLTPTCYVEDTIIGDWNNVADPLYTEAISYLHEGQCSEVNGNKAKPTRAVYPNISTIDWHENSVSLPQTR
jgi:carboxyl-terminal processing protease